MSEGKKKKVLFALPVMKGGGAERVAALLTNEFHANGIETSVLLTSSGSKDVVRQDLNADIPLHCLPEMPFRQNAFMILMEKTIRLCSSAICRIVEKIGRPVPAGLAFVSFWSQNRKEILQLREILKADPDLEVIAFLQPTIPMVVLAARGLPNRIIISERGDPRRLMKKRYGRRFVARYYTQVAAAVFQTNDAKDTYPEWVRNKGIVIPNPIKSDLPEPYLGERNRNITTFCRISLQKNLPLLLMAFQKLHLEQPEYTLRIIGDSFNDEGRSVERQLKEYIQENGLSECVCFEPFKQKVHEAILKDAMYVNSSDYEGISNAMLEAMAIGMPVVCTDCPIGGAGATIKNKENGLLVPIQNADALYQAMKKIVEDPQFAREMASNAAKIREEYAVGKIAEKWMELL